MDTYKIFIQNILDMWSYYVSIHQPDPQRNGYEISANMHPNRTVIFLDLTQFQTLQFCLNKVERFFPVLTDVTSL